MSKITAVIDLEATCTDKNEFPAHEMETIEIGVAIVDTSTLKIIDKHQQYIRPMLHPTLTEFCTKLTGITQKKVDDALWFHLGLANVSEFFIKHKVTDWCSWGDYDREQLKRDCKRHEIGYPAVLHNHFNLKVKFSQELGTKRRYGLKRALQRLNMEFEGSPHSGVDDAYNTARIYIELIKMKQNKVQDK